MLFGGGRGCAARPSGLKREKRPENDSRIAARPHHHADKEREHAVRLCRDRLELLVARLKLQLKVKELQLQLAEKGSQA